MARTVLAGLHVNDLGREPRSFVHQYIRHVGPMALNARRIRNVWMIRDRARILGRRVEFVLVGKRLVRWTTNGVDRVVIWEGMNVGCLTLVLMGFAWT
jgi:hypothetical protein